MVHNCIVTLSSSEKEHLSEKTEEFLSFRKSVAEFLTQKFGSICTRKCYKSELSACCSKEGIITFFADIVINVLSSTEDEIKNILTTLHETHTGTKCVYLGEDGCLWRVKPIVCEMFLCDSAKDEVFAEFPRAEKKWQEFKKEEKRFKWPDRPVLFDMIESYFIDKGFTSKLMYLHNSPGLLRVKENAIKKGIYR